MEPNELDVFLRKPTPREQLCLAGQDIPHRKEKLETLTLNGREFSVFHLSEKTEPLSGGRHSRYIDYPVHIHPWVELNYMYSGSCVQKVNGKPVTLSKGQTLLLDFHTVHDLPVLGEQDILLNIFIRREYLNAGFFSRFSRKNIVSQFLVNSITEGLTHDSYIFFPSENSRRLPLFIREFFCEQFDPSECAQDIKSSLFTLILTELIDVCQKTARPETHLPQGDVILPVLKYIEEHCQTVTLRELSHVFCLNPDYLSRLLKTRTGSSFQALLTTQRMNAAGDLLKNSSLSVEEIARRVGYHNLTFFYKKFSEVFGCPPGKYRSQ